MHILRTAITVLFVVGITYQYPAYAELYIYRGPDGTRWITDHRKNVQDYTLLRRLGYREAALACAGLNRKTLATKAGVYAREISTSARAFGIDKALVKAIIHVESCFNRRAVSRAGARGLMQLMPATARRLGVRNSFNPAQNIRGGVKYMRDLLTMFGDDMRLALAAYNAGENAVRQHNGVPPFRETRDYIRKVLHYYDVYRQTSIGEAYRAQ